MTNEVLQKAEKFNKKNQSTRRLKKLMGIMSCLVIMMTMGLLMIPAQTEDEALLKTYLQENGGEFGFILTDAEDNEILKNEAGEYIVYPDEGYKLSMEITSSQKIVPGTYNYQFPESLIIAEEEGELIIEGDEEAGDIKAGSWSVDDNRLAVFAFDELAEEYAELKMIAVMSVSFSESEEPMDFDGKITVAVEKPADEQVTDNTLTESEPGLENEGSEDEQSGGELLDEGFPEDPSDKSSGSFCKELIEGEEGRMKCVITVNEEKEVLSNGTPLMIHDVMSNTVSYVAGTIAIEAEDADGNITTLTEGEDFTFTYDGSDECIEEGEYVHVMDIIIMDPQPVEYTLTYETASIEKQSRSSGVTEGYRAVVAVADADTAEPLAGAVFGLYSEDGGLMDSMTTDENGSASFETKSEEGITLAAHTPYYIQEIEAPDGYLPSEENFWIVFCSSGELCEECNQMIGMHEGSMMRIISGEDGVISVENQQGGYKLPETGGIGTVPYYLAGMLLICMAGSLITVNSLKRRRKA